MAGIAFGNTLIGKENKDPYLPTARSCPVGTTLADGSRLICKAGGVAWFVAPASTQIGSQWAGGQYNSTAVGNKCCVSEWGVLGSCLSARRYNPTEWFVPSSAQLQNPGYTCRTNWGFCSNYYWSSTETNFNTAWATDFTDGSTFNFFGKTEGTFCVRAFRCVTY